MAAVLPAGWEAFTDPEGRTYYANVSTNEVSWEPPNWSAPPLPAGWTAHQDQEGRTFYAHESGTTQWEMPALEPIRPALVGGWSLEQAQDVGGKSDEQNLIGYAQLLDVAMHTSVATTVDQLNSGVISVEAGYCLIFSTRKERFYLLWREDKQDVALQRFGIGDAQWSELWAHDIGDAGPETEQIFQGRAQYLDPSQHSSVRSTVEALNAGSIQADAGYCVLFSQTHGRYFLLWRSGCDALAFSALGLQMPQ